ncbi:MAG: DUF1624 domain-containing protein [Bacteroidota bacterium]
MTTELPSSGPQRIDSIDIMRGAVMVIMALDHVRDMFSITPFPPEDVTQTTIAFFLTRWITHFCAPTFVFLAGVGVFLYQARGRTKGETAKFLLTRGLWLIILEMIWVNPSWGPVYYRGFMFVQVIWAIGWSMIILAGLIWLPRIVVASIALAMILGHNLLDGVRPEEFGSLAPLWGLLHQQYFIPMSETFGLFVIYPLIPWIGVMAAGYVVGMYFKQPAEERKRALMTLGAIAVSLFVLLRLTNFYGDPNPWLQQERGEIFSFFSFLNASKYPPSLLFLCMTIGPVLLFLPALERGKGRLANFFVTFGRVPFFFYMLHVGIIHLLAIIWWYPRFGSIGWWFGNPENYPAGYEPNLFLAYSVWAVVIMIMYILCRWFVGVKRRRKEWWLSYL